jgi:NADH dehydrogenase [ubiquinone] 1 alpha subcomplex assembly factor 5
MWMATSEIVVFDRALLRRRRDRAARRPGDHDFLFRETAERLVDRLDDVSRDFGAALDIGARDGGLSRALTTRRKAAAVHACDLSEGFARSANSRETPTVVADEERLPFKEGSFDLVVSNLALHWVNDLPGALIQIARVLKPDGLFQGVILGGESLGALRGCLLDAELEITGGASPRVSPMVDLRDAAGLLQRAGFALPVADLDRIEVAYPDMFRLMADLRAMGETNAGLERLRVPTRRGVFLRAAQLYAERHAGPDGRILARFDAIFLHGWRPSASQPKPLRPGSATARLADALDTEEKPAGDPAAPPSKE